MRFALVIFPITLVVVPAFGQAAKVYKWQHPWFKKEISSPTPPTWPYRVIDEKSGVVRVEVIPPEDQKSASPTPPRIVSTPAPQPKEPIMISEDTFGIPKELYNRCVELGSIVVKIRGKGKEESPDFKSAFDTWFNTCNVRALLPYMKGKNYKSTEIPVTPVDWSKLSKQ